MLFRYVFNWSDKLGLSAKGSWKISFLVVVPILHTRVVQDAAKISAVTENVHLYQSGTLVRDLRIFLIIASGSLSSDIRIPAHEPFSGRLNRANSLRRRDTWYIIIVNCDLGPDLH